MVTERLSCCIPYFINTQRHRRRNIGELNVTVSSTTRGETLERVEELDPWRSYTFLKEGVNEDRACSRFAATIRSEDRILGNRNPGKVEPTERVFFLKKGGSAVDLRDNLNLLAANGDR